MHELPSRTGGGPLPVSHPPGPGPYLNVEPTMATVAAAPPATSAGQYTQATRPMELMTPLGKDALLIERFNGNEAISQLFSFHVEALAANQTNVAFDRLLGQKCTVRVDTPGGDHRYFNGICARVSQGGRDQVFT